MTHRAICDILQAVSITNRLLSRSGISTLIPLTNRSNFSGGVNLLRGAGSLKKEIKMSPYLVNLTNNLIGSGRFDATILQIPRREVFVEHVKEVILDSEMMQKIAPCTLGGMVCGFEIADLSISKEELFQVHFSGSVADTFKEWVSLLLAYAIWERLSPSSVTGVPRYRRHQPIRFMNIDEKRRAIKFRDVSETPDQIMNRLKRDADKRPDFGH